MKMQRRMQPFKRHYFAIIYIAACAYPIWAAAQNSPEKTTKIEAFSVCTEARSIETAQLFGSWIVEFFPIQDANTSAAAATAAQTPVASASLLLEKNAEHEDSLSGWLSLAVTNPASNALAVPPVKIFVAGDIEEGVLSLDESQDGSSISGQWDGAIAPGSCGRAITGTRRVGELQMRFILRRAGGWN